MGKRSTKTMTALLGAITLAATMTAPVDARRGGSFGSRGSRTYLSPRATRTAPDYTPGLSRSMTERSAANPSSSQYGSSYGAGYGQRARPRFGFGSGLLAGVVAGGLFGSLFGHGGGYGSYGSGSGGLLAMLIQLAIIGGIVWLAFRVFRGRSPRAAESPFVQTSSPMPFRAGGFTAPPAVPSDDITISAADQRSFETLLGELQDAFGHEDYGRLRAITTPEIMSYLAEELSDNATHGRRNEVTATRLIDADVSEAWREADADYATIAMRYESIDVMRDRATGAILGGDPGLPSQTTEIWTFIRTGGAWSPWKVSAIQEA